MSNKYLVFLGLSLSLFIICAACGTHVNGGGEDSVTGRVEFVVSGTSDGGSAIALPNAKVPNDPH
jgi:hypothetical protein